MKLKTMLLVACLVALPAFASDVAVNTDVKAIVAQQQAIRVEVQAAAGRYKDMPSDKRADLLARQDRVLNMLEGHELSTELSQNQQLQLFNELEAIGALVNDAEDERMICERVKPVGSNRPVRMCKTVAQRRAEQNGVEEVFGKRDQRCSGTCMTPPGAW